MGMFINKLKLNAYFNGNKMSAYFNGMKVLMGKKVEKPSDIKLKSLGSKITINNKWTTPIIVDGEIVSQDIVINTEPGQVITISESNKGQTFRKWHLSSAPFMYGSKCEVIEMPSMDSFCKTNEGLITDDYFFYSFNYRGNITKLPEGSFDTSKIKEVGDYFFSKFTDTDLRTLPSGSFNISNIKLAGEQYLDHFGESILHDRVSGVSMTNSAAPYVDFWATEIDDDGSLDSYAEIVSLDETFRYYKTNEGVN